MRRVFSDATFLDLRDARFRRMVVRARRGDALGLDLGADDIGLRVGRRMLGFDDIGFHAAQLVSGGERCERACDEQHRDESPLPQGDGILHAPEKFADHSRPPIATM
jgi:hypothetical protein